MRSSARLGSAGEASGRERRDGHVVRARVRDEAALYRQPSGACGLDGLVRAREPTIAQDLDGARPALPRADARGPRERLGRIARAVGGLELAQGLGHERLLGGHRVHDAGVRARSEHEDAVGRVEAGDARERGSARSIEASLRGAFAHAFCVLEEGLHRGARVEDEHEGLGLVAILGETRLAERERDERGDEQREQEREQVLEAREEARAALVGERIAEERHPRHRHDAAAEAHEVEHHDRARREREGGADLGPRPAEELEAAHRLVALVALAHATRITRRALRARARATPTRPTVRRSAPPRRRPASAGSRRGRAGGACSAPPRSARAARG